MPLLQRKPNKAYSICERSFEKLFNIFKKKLTQVDRKKDLLILMRVKQDNWNDSKKKDLTTPDKVTKMGWRMSKLMSKDSLVTWAAQGYKFYRFDFYFYDKPKFKRGKGYTLEEWHKRLSRIKIQSK